MIDHLSTYATDFDATKRFYDGVLGTLGYTIQKEMVMTWDQDLPGRRACAYGLDKPVFWVVEVIASYQPRHVAFSAADHESVRRFHEAALASGGKDNGAPGPRPMYHQHYYGAFAFDPDGNNVEAVCHQP